MCAYKIERGIREPIGYLNLWNAILSYSTFVGKETSIHPRYIHYHIWNT